MASSCTWVTARPLYGVQAQVGKCADDDGLEVHHEVLPERGVLEPREQKQARRLDAPPATMTRSASIDALDPVGADESTPVARRPRCGCGDT